MVPGSHRTVCGGVEWSGVEWGGVEWGGGLGQFLGSALVKLNNMEYVYNVLFVFGVIKT